ncbi:MAG TPA: esterase-like activity of phytase family protein, partial [Vicinamibacteria bacterium]|nr:esterase-like activity of phytase family protein [Vicinamibacteria bacterium]
MLRLTLAILAVGLALLATRPPEVDPILHVSVAPVPLNPKEPGQSIVGGLRYRGGLVLRATTPRFGGLSDLRVIEGGRRAIAVSDCGSGFEAELGYDEQGSLVGLSRAQLRPLVGPGGRPLAADEDDAESLARAPDGALIVGFEQRHRLWRYPPGGAPLSLPPDLLAAPPGSALLDPNEGMEAVLSLEDGRLVVFTEAVRPGGRTALGWIEKGAVWEEFELPLAYANDAPREPFRPTGAALLPGGDVLLLERRYPPVAVRVRRIPRSALESGGDLEGTEVARLAPPLTVDNFEGLDVAMAPDGTTRVYLISDDNDCAKAGHRHGTSSQRTLLL